MTAKKDDLGQAEVQKKVDQETEQGYRGTKVDPTPDAEYTLTTGPDSPPHVADDTTRVDQHSTTKES